MKLAHSLLTAALSLALGASVSAAELTPSGAKAVLARSGYTDISPVEYRNGLWFATARSVDGTVVDVSVNPVGQVITKRTTIITTTSKKPPVRVVQVPVAVEKVIVIPSARRPIMVEKRVLVPVGGTLNRNDVAVVLAAHGYHDVHDIEWLSSRNRWKAEARDSTGDDREVHVDPIDGRILHEEND